MAPTDHARSDTPEPRTHVVPFGVEQAEREREKSQQPQRVEGPYPMCSTPAKCNLKGYCDREYACND